MLYTLNHEPEPEDSPFNADNVFFASNLLFYGDKQQSGMGYEFLKDFVSYCYSLPDATPHILDGFKPNQYNLLNRQNKPNFLI